MDFSAIIQALLGGQQTPPPYTPPFNPNLPHPMDPRGQGGMPGSPGQNPVPGGPMPTQSGSPMSQGLIQALLPLLMTRGKYGGFRGAGYADSLQRQQQQALQQQQINQQGWYQQQGVALEAERNRISKEAEARQKQESEDRMFRDAEERLRRERADQIARDRETRLTNAQITKELRDEIDMMPPDTSPEDLETKARTLAEQYKVDSATMDSMIRIARNSKPGRKLPKNTGLLGEYEAVKAAGQLPKNVNTFEQYAQWRERTTQTSTHYPSVEEQLAALYAKKELGTASAADLARINGLEKAMNARDVRPEAKMTEAQAQQQARLTADSLFRDEMGKLTVSPQQYLDFVRSYKDQLMNKTTPAGESGIIEVTDKKDPSVQKMIQDCINDPEINLQQSIGQMVFDGYLSPEVGTYIIAEAEKGRKSYRGKRFYGMPGGFRGIGR